MARFRYQPNGDRRNFDRHGWGARAPLTTIKFPECIRGLTSHLAWCGAPSSSLVQGFSTMLGSLSSTAVHSDALALYGDTGYPRMGKSASIDGPYDIPYGRAGCQEASSRMRRTSKGRLRIPPSARNPSTVGEGEALLFRCECDLPDEHASRKLCGSISDFRASPNAGKWGHLR